MLALFLYDGVGVLVVSGAGVSFSVGVDVGVGLGVGAFFSGVLRFYYLFILSFWSHIYFFI